MHIRNQGPGIHAREVPGLEKLKGLPNDFRLCPVQSMAMIINRSAQ